LSERSQTLDGMNDMRMNFAASTGNPAAKTSYTKKRADEVKGRAMMLSYNTIVAHVTEVTHALAWQRWLIDANRILNGLSDPIRKHYGVENYNEMKLLLIDIAKGDNAGTKTSERILNHIRVGSTMVGMAWRIKTALLQPSGIFQSWSRLGGKWVAIGVSQFLANPIKSLKLIERMSTMMPHRSVTMAREVNEVIGGVRGGKKMNIVKASMFLLIAKMQKLVDVPTWLGAYEKSLAQLQYENAGNEEQRQQIEQMAADMADQEVKDTQAAGQIHDQAHIQRGGPGQKLFTNFYSFFSTTYQLNVGNYRKTNFKNPKEFAEFMIDTFLVNVMPGVYTTILGQLLKGECENWEMECMLKNLASEEVSFLMGQMIPLREFAAAASHVVPDQYYFDYKGPAALRIFEEGTKFTKEMMKGPGDWGEKTIVTSLNMAGFVLHLPGGQVGTTYKGAQYLWDHDDVEPDRILPILMVGPPPRN